MPRLHRTALLLMVGLACLGLGFAWGFLSYREKMFPFFWLRLAAVRLGAVKGDTGVPWQAVASPRPSLTASPYLDGTFDHRTRRSGVLKVDAKQVSPGHTLVLTRSHGQAVALLTGLDGRTVWTWPLRAIEAPQLALILPDGELLVLDANHAVVRLDRSGKVRWRTAGAFHHSLSVEGDRLLTLRSHRRPEPSIHRAAQVLDDEIVTLDLEGRELGSFSLLEALLASPYAFLLHAPGDAELRQIAFGRGLAELELDLLHSNHVSLTGAPAAEVEALRESGNYLVSVRNLNLLAVLDRESHEVRWAWGPGRLVQQHHPTLLPSGRLLVFSNGLVRSEVLEVDPQARRVEWRYTSDDFFTSLAGSCQRLPNGNTLITESMTGYVFEVTPALETVWVWANPDLAQGGIRQAIYRATRYSPEELGWLPSQ